MATFQYTYSIEHKPVDLNSPLWKVRIDRPLEWQALVKTLEESPSHIFYTLLSVPDIKSCLNRLHHHTGTYIFFMFTM